MVKNPPANAGDTGSVPGWGRSLEKGTAARFSILAWRIPWTEEPGELSPTESQSWTRLATKVSLVKVMVFPVVMYGCESWTIKKAEC